MPASARSSEKGRQCPRHEEGSASQGRVLTLLDSGPRLLSIGLKCHLMGGLTSLGGLTSPPAVTHTAHCLVYGPPRAFVDLYGTVLPLATA